MSSFLLIHGHHLAKKSPYKFDFMEWLIENMDLLTRNFLLNFDLFYTAGTE